MKKRKFLISTILVTTLLSLNLSAAGKIKCTDTYCIVNLSKNAKKDTQKEIQEEIEGYKTIIIDNIETIVFDASKYKITQEELVENELEEMQKNLLLPSLDSSDLPLSDFLCEDDLEPVLVAGVDNTYECTKS